MKFCRCGVLLMAAIAWLNAESSKTSDSWTDILNRWICTHLGYGCSGVTKTTRNRGLEKSRPRGKSLNTLNLKTGAVTRIWQDCDCWSPVPAGKDSLWVASRAGIYRVIIAAEPRREQVLRATDIEEMLGGQPGSKELFFVRSSEAAECKFQLWKFDIEKGSASPAGAPGEPNCGADVDFRSIAKAGQTGSQGRLVTLRESEEQYKIGLIPSPPAGLRVIEEDRAGSQFDAVWTDSDVIAFVESK